MGGTYTCDEVPKDIPDPGTMEVSLTVPDSFVIKDVNVVLNIAHSFDADLSAYLIAPDGTTEVVLFSKVGSMYDDFKNTVLDDEAATPIADGSAPFMGSFQPTGSLADFDGLDAQGTWQLRIIDAADVDSGTLQSWHLIIEPCIFPSEPNNPDPADGAENVSIDTLLSWDEDSASSATTWDVYLGADSNAPELIASDLNEPSCSPGQLEVETSYSWQVIAKNPCGETLGPVWSFMTTGVPVAMCQDVTVPAEKNRQAAVTAADVDCGSYDPDGDDVTLSLDPEGPYAIGEHEVTLTVTDEKGISATCSATVTVLPTAYSYKEDAIAILEGLVDPNDPNDPLLEAIDNLKMSLGGDVVENEDDVFWAGPNRIALAQGGNAGAKVFEYEQAACDLLDTSDPNIAAAVDLLTTADKILVDTVISDAAFQGADVTEAKALRNEGNYAEAWQAAADGLRLPPVQEVEVIVEVEVEVEVPVPTLDYNEDGTVDIADLLKFAEDLLGVLAP
jgi:subtilisin-like proprotein convertase family protein